jgi:hypothetical protein
MSTKIYLGYPQEYIKNNIKEEFGKRTIVKYSDGSIKSFLIKEKLSGTW